MIGHEIGVAVFLILFAIGGIGWMKLQERLYEREQKRRREEKRERHAG